MNFDNISELAERENSNKCLTMQTLLQQMNVKSKYNDPKRSIKHNMTNQSMKV